MTVSAIVPIYNVEPYLSECIESLIHQSWQQMEIILVNDGSTDASGIICEQYAARDKRIIVINKENGGLVSARKTGLRCSTGEYVIYVDGDDWVDAHMVETLIRQCENEKTDIICFAAYEEGNGYRALKRNYVEEGIYKREKEKQKIYQNMLMDGIFYEQGILAYIWCKFFRREILLGAQESVPNGIVYGEDAACVYPALLEAESIQVTNLPLYHYRNRKESLARGIAVDGQGLAQLYMHLYQCFLKHKERAILIQQLEGFIKSIFLLKDCSLPVYDALVFPYSDISAESEVVIYGAGLMGQSMMRRCKERGIHAAGWVDQNASFYRSMGLKVLEPGQIKELAFDKIILTILNSRTAKRVENELICMGINPQKISRLNEAKLEEAGLPGWLVCGEAGGQKEEMA